jgi:tetratricopeptide (TPR) repeat protein
LLLQGLKTTGGVAAIILRAFVIISIRGSFRHVVDWNHMNGHEELGEEPETNEQLMPATELGLPKRKPLRWMIPLIILAIASFVVVFFILLQSPQVKARKYLKEAYDHFERGEFEQALADANRAIDVDSDYGPAYAYRGNAHLYLGDPQQAILDCDRAIELDPDYGMSYAIRGYAYSNMSDFERAIEDCSKAIELAPGHWQIYASRGCAYFELGHYEDAISTYGLSLLLNKLKHTAGVALFI